MHYNTTDMRKKQDTIHYHTSTLEVGIHVLGHNDTPPRLLGLYALPALRFVPVARQLSDTLAHGVPRPAGYGGYLHHELWVGIVVPLWVVFVSGDEWRIGIERGRDRGIRN